MKEITTIEEMHQVQKGILEHVADFCEANHIRYFLCAGTVLGAIRHKGFIPWDDDVDIMMFRKDYERFIALYPQNDQSTYTLYHPSLQKDYNYPSAKVGDSRTGIDEHIKNACNFGVYMDVFPIDNLPDDEEKRLQLYRKQKDTKLIHLIKVRAIKHRPGLKGLFKNVGLIAGKTLYAWMPMHKVVQKMDQTARTYENDNDTQFCGLVAWGYGKREIMPREIYNGSAEAEFEGRSYPIPPGYDAYLTRLYGDYMQLPPEEEREVHGFKAWWKD